MFRASTEIRTEWNTVPINFRLMGPMARTHTHTKRGAHQKGPTQSTGGAPQERGGEQSTGLPLWREGLKWDGPRVQPN